MSGTIDSRMRAVKCCIVVPTYNNAPFLPKLLQQLQELSHYVIIVNDGSTDTTPDLLEPYSHQYNIIHHDQNKGKGMAMRNAFAEAWKKGFHYAITIDSDGQHLLADLPKFLDKIEAEPESLIVGARNMNQAGVPGKSSFGHRFSNFWFLVETFKKLPDTQSGYRLYPLKPISQMKFYTQKFEFEIEVLVRLAWNGVPVTSVPVSVVYHKEDRITHFRPFRDFLRISVLNSMLVLMAYLYIHPRNFFRALTRNNLKEFFDRNLFRTGASNAKLAAEIGFGLFMGIIPIWGYQMITAVFLSHLMKLNKVVVLLAANISIPPMIPFIIYGSYLLGGLLIDTPGSPLVFDSNMTFDVIGSHLLQYLVGAVMLAILAGIAGGMLFYILFRIFRKNPAQTS